jgi:ATP-dependent exoDNAse (exonuclease V) beta subunit
LLQEKHYFVPNLEHLVISENQLSNFDIENIPLITLLFQTGYLTIANATKIGTQHAYVLRYPNLEVKASLNNSLLELGVDSIDKNEYSYKLSTALNENNFAQLKAIFSAHFAAIPNDWYRNNHIADYEGFYASVVYSYFAALGYDLIAEDVTNHGKIDLTIKMPDKILIIEFKLNKYGNASEALAQIRSKGYASKYLAENKEIYLLGMSFDCEQKNVVDFICELN